MRNADKIIIGFLIALVIGAGYFQYLAEKLNERMDEIKTIDQKLKVVIFSKILVGNISI